MFLFSRSAQVPRALAQLCSSLRTSLQSLSRFCPAVATVSNTFGSLHSNNTYALRWHAHRKGNDFRRQARRPKFLLTGEIFDECDVVTFMPQTKFVLAK